MASSSVLILHIAAGTAGLLSGLAALLLRKGSGGHRAAGKIFVVSMAIMAANASVLGYLRQEWNDVLGGITTIYFVATAWMTLRRKAGETGRFEIIAFLVAIAGSAGNIALALEASNSEQGLLYGFPAGFYYFFAGLITVFAAGDLRLILRGGITGAQRIARHLWRMCYAVFIATGSLFLGQMQVFPEFIRETNILFVLAFLPLALMGYWLLRVGLSKKYKASLNSVYQRQTRQDIQI